MQQDTFQRSDERTALTAGHQTRPEGGVLRNYVKCIPRDTVHSRHCKTIVNTKHADIAEGCAGPPTGFDDAGLHRDTSVLHLHAPYRMVMPANARRPHHFRYKLPWFAIDEHHRRQDEPIFQEGRGSVDKIAVHHYVTKCDALQHTRRRMALLSHTLTAQ